VETTSKHRFATRAKSSSSHLEPHDAIEHLFRRLGRRRAAGRARAPPPRLVGRTPPPREAPKAPRLVEVAQDPRGDHDALREVAELGRGGLGQRLKAFSPSHRRLAVLAAREIAVQGRL
jgi:hypothetical protein